MTNRFPATTSEKLRNPVLTGTLLVLLTAFQLMAQAPGTVSFQGLLTNTGGTPVDTMVPMTFTLYKGTTDVWSEVHPSVTVGNGVFDVVLGDITVLDTLQFDRRMELGITIADDPEMSPRVELVSTAFARALPGFSTKLSTEGVSDSTFNVVGGWRTNEIASDALGATISGGGGRYISTDVPNRILSGADFATVGGGLDNTADGRMSTISGGLDNMTGGTYATVGGGFDNESSGLSSVVGGGQSNVSSALASTVAGGQNNVASTGFATVGGGAQNEADFDGATVGGGQLNFASGEHATVGGGLRNLATANYATVGGGLRNAARGQYSFAAGFNARPQHEGSFVWADHSVTQNRDSLITTGVNQFLIRASGGVGIGTNDPGDHGLSVIDSTAGGIPGATLNVENKHTGQAIAAHFRSNGTDATLVLGQDGTGDHIRTFDNGNLRFRVYDDGNVTADGTFTGGGADLAEAVEIDGGIEEYEAGDVMVVSTSKDRSFAISREPYSELLAGVYATKPGVLMTDRGISEDLSERVPMGVVGIIPTKVTTENGSIQRGDLLVTSSTPGHAMRADRSRLEFGMVLGKALEPFDGPGDGMIEVLVMPR